MRTFRTGLFLGLLIALVGCSRSGPSARVTGSFTYKGQLLKAGLVYVVFDEGGEYNAGIKADGTFQFIDLPSGAAKVLVSTETYNPDQRPPVYTQAAKQYNRGVSKGYSEYNAAVGKGQQSGGPMPPGGGLSKERKAELAQVYVKIPRKYGDKNTTPLNVTVESGSQTWNFELTD